LAKLQIAQIDAMAAKPPTAIDFEFTPFGSTAADKLSSHFGRPLVVNFWAAWCESCAEELLLLEEQAQKHPQVRFIGIATDRADDPPGFAKRLGLTWLNGLDGTAAPTLNVISTPRTLFLDSKGKLVVDFDGALTPTAIEAAIAKIK
jgi:thiol-disulfide isomerase/thioredoxin